MTETSPVFGIGTGASDEARGWVPTGGRLFPSAKRSILNLRSGEITR